MELNIGNKIRELRRQKNISQEVLAQYLGVTFQAVSKRESATTMPDITLVPAIASIPEIYFTKLELEAALLKGTDRFRAANIQKNLSADSLLQMLQCLAEHYKEAGEPEKARIQMAITVNVIKAFREDFLTEGMRSTVYESHRENLEKLNARLQAMQGIHRSCR